MPRTIRVEGHLTLEDYEAVAHLTGAVLELRREAATLAPGLKGRTVWMVNSTAQGGGVAEMLPRMISILRELGVATEWAVIDTERTEFFHLTKRLHNLLHGFGDPALGPADRELYEAVSAENAAALARNVGPRDVLVIHDPQPLGTGALLKEKLDLPALWRCHIGLDERPPQVQAAWRFLEPYACRYDQAVFSAPEYIPEFLAGRAGIIYPALDPLGYKNRELSVHKLLGILCNASLAIAHEPVLTPPFDHPARRLMPDGSWAPACGRGEIGLIYRPTVTQISRWDRLKGFRPLMEAFVRLKARADDPDVPKRHRRRLEIVRLVLAGPDPQSVADDPEAVDVLDSLKELYLRVPPPLKHDIALLALPMHSTKENALMVNALQRCASVVAQNSLREGFGLTATEAMWKRTAVVGSHACGLRQQIRDGIDGRLIPDPEDPQALAGTLDELLADPVQRALLGRNGQRRVHDEFVIFAQLRRWLRTLVECVQRLEARN
jgi:trehalose synthase